MQRNFISAKITLTGSEASGFPDSSAGQEPEGSAESAPDRALGRRAAAGRGGHPKAAAPPPRLCPAAAGDFVYPLASPRPAIGHQPLRQRNALLFFLLPHAFTQGSALRETLPLQTAYENPPSAPCTDLVSTKGRCGDLQEVPPAGGNPSAGRGGGAGPTARLRSSGRRLPGSLSL